MGLSAEPHVTELRAAAISKPDKRFQAQPQRSLAGREETERNQTIRLWGRIACATGRDTSSQSSD